MSQCVVQQVSDPVLRRLTCIQFLHCHVPAAPGF
uniref:Uncharacterized protein n=1 Tax=Anguilla anguilla TaxID=7936 RepID=A0A0E9SUH3_ANGAN